MPKHMHRVYSYMDENSEMYNFGLREEPVKVWRGLAKEIAKVLEVSPDVVYKCNGQLEILGCIDKLKSGAHSTPSIFELKKPPSDHEYQLSRERAILAGSLLLPSKNDRLIDSINRLNSRVDELEERLSRFELDARTNNRRNSPLSSV